MSRKNPCKPATWKATNHEQREIPIFDGSEFGTDKPKSKETMDKIKKMVIDQQRRRDEGGSEPPRKKVAREGQVSVSTNSIDQPKTTNQNDQSSRSCMKPISLGELWCKEEDHQMDAEEEDDDEDDDDEDDDKSKVVFLPTTPQQLCNRFNKLFCEFTRQGKINVNCRNEMVFLLDEMLRKDFITRLDYETLNNILAAQSLGYGLKEKEEDEEEEDELEEEVEGEVVNRTKSLIRSTTDYMIKHDKDELKDLIEDFRKEDPKEFIQSGMENLIDRFLNHDDEEIITTILTTIRGFDNIPRSKLYRIEMLLNRIDRNRNRVRSILTRLDDVVEEDDIANTLKLLAREELISNEQYEKLMKDDATLELNTIADIIKTGREGWK